MELSLEMILGDDRLIDMFAVHLIKEFSVECLLSLIEFEQFHRAVAVCVSSTKYNSIVCASNVPLSDIVYGSGTKDGKANSLKESAYRLFEKYVETYAEFEINISGHARTKLTVLFSDYDAWMAMDIGTEALCSLFDDCMQAMLCLLRSSKTRFQVDTLGLVAG